MSQDKIEEFLKTQLVPLDQYDIGYFLNMNIATANNLLFKLFKSKRCKRTRLNSYMNTNYKRFHYYINDIK